jgi:hypothetical protein
LSAFCAECSYAGQRLFVSTTSDLLGRSAVNAIVVSVVAWDARAAQGQLARECQLFAPLSRKLRNALTAAGVRQAFGGFDVSANEHAAQRFAPHYRPHAWIFAPASQMARGERVFRQFFPTSRIVRRPVQMHRFDGDLRGLAYALKTNFSRRVSLEQGALANGDIVRRNTRLRPLLARQKVELALALDKIGIGARLFLHGLRIVESCGVVRLKRIDVALPPKIGGHDSRGSSRKPHPDSRAQWPGDPRTAPPGTATSPNRAGTAGLGRGPARR